MKNLTILKSPGALALAILLARSVHAQSEASLTNYFTPSFRTQTGSESVVWSDSFTNAYGSSNQAAVVAPGGAVLANASVSQTTPGAFIIGSPAGDIYSFSSTNTFVLNYSVSNPIGYSNGIGGVVFQAETAGSELDYSTTVLAYQTCSGVQTLTAVRNEVYRDTQNTTFGPSSDVVSEWQWQAMPVGVTNFTIIFNGSGASVAMERVMFEVTPAVAPAGPFSLQSVPANISRWMYPFNQSPANRDTASTFAAFGSLPAFDTRDGQYLLGWNTSNSVPAGQGAPNYLVNRVRVTLTLSSDLYYAYDGVLRDYRTYFPTNDPRYVPTTNTGGPVELFGAGFRGAFTNSFGTITPYSALNFPQDGPYGANPNGGDFSNRVAYAACFSTNGLLVDVSDNVGDNGTNEIANPFEVAPFAVGATTNAAPGQLMPAGSQLTFDLNLNDPLIYGYVQQGLNQGNLSFIVSSLVNANFFSGSPNWPDFYTIFNVLADTNQFPLLSVQGTVVRPCRDNDGDGLADDWEQFYFGSLGAGATNISDGDGISNLAKYVAGTNPTDTATDLRLLSVSQQPSGTEIHFVPAPSHKYTVQWSGDLVNWQTVTNPLIGYSSAWLAKSGTNLVYPSPVYAVWRDTNAPTQQRFYRIGVR
jgi:hypothetical protein